MPNVGEIKSARELGKTDTYKYIWAACLNCGKERWVLLRKGKPQSIRCRSCKDPSKISRGDNHHSWKGGRTQENGYICIKLQPNDFYYPMTNQHGYVFEHRLVIAKKLGRYLLPYPIEIVHHKDGIKDHNYNDNLVLSSIRGHPLETKNSIKMAYNQGFQDGLKIRTDELHKEIRLLRWELKQVIKEHTLL